MQQVYKQKRKHRNYPPPKLRNYIKTYTKYGDNDNTCILDISESLPLHLFGIFASGLYCGMFKRNLIEKFHMRFDTAIFKAEDWLFYTQYLSRSKKEIIVDIPLYHYYQREGSIINTYYEETDKGIEKGRYILQQFENYLLNANIPKEWYSTQLSQRYFQSVLRFSINIWNFQNKRSFWGKYKKIRMYVKRYIPYSNIDVESLSLSQKVLFKANSALLLSAYGIMFNTAKHVKLIISCKKSLFCSTINNK